MRDRGRIVIGRHLTMPSIAVLAVRNPALRAPCPKARRYETRHEPTSPGPPAGHPRRQRRAQHCGIDAFRARKSAAGVPRYAGRHRGTAQSARRAMSDATMTATDLATRLGLSRESRSWRGDCPACGYARAFSVRAATEGGAARLYCASGCTFRELQCAVGQIAGNGWTNPPRPSDAELAASRERKQGYALRLWEGSEPAPESLVAAYLQSRRLGEFSRSKALRFRKDCPHPETRQRLPAMMALITSPDGAPMAIHRTFLKKDGSGKAMIVPDRASLGSFWTGAIRLDPAGTELAIGEGIETAASAGKLLNLPAWAAISAGNMAAAIVLPAEVRAVVIAVDREPTGERSAQAAAGRLRSEGRTVRFLMPCMPGMDANDTLMKRTSAGVSAHG